MSCFETCFILLPPPPCSRLCPLVRLTSYFKTEVLTGAHPPGSEGATPVTFPRKSLLDEMTDKFWVDDDRVTD